MSKVNRLGQRSLNTPSVSIDAGVKRVVINAESLRPLYHAHGSTIEREHTATARISALMFSGSPATILGRIPFAIFDTIKRMAVRRSGLHVSNKCFERAPSVTDGNTAPTIVFVPRVFRVFTSLVHRDKDIVLRRAGKSVVTRLFKHHTAAGLSVAPHKVAAKDNSFCLTDAAAQPFNFTGIGSFNRSNYCQTTKRNPSDVFGAGVEWYNFVSHIDSFLISLVRWRSVSAGRTPIITHFGKGYAQWGSDIQSACGWDTQRLTEINGDHQ